ncbi:hypothetical protein [uncultured Gammaproteobacteria bacterium]|uniref:Uncharacterized protein n=2 Tax=sulfur-oxidizing symbionts TaxID=32036 RepID=A0A1H6KDA5_9GAMM|nr:hypothetical protein [Bathymodiolus thermophilus thioautotrophic gill symbiont]CAC5853069.1 hypothetical protein [uncultured Gammaproteobacteria bacterium]SEH73495.1 hypothetical protein BAZSYMA_ACONTIG91948_0 [Bathymodiolus azoricus thioautotrophic gill symbiont]CAB5498066.1 hypothetical protein AZO1586I_276 [Bathymodiolus thermophilus thioautotrophic gill symbiont]CAC9505462.1 hypothetical protein [uncultured Gammaproteobacteria bacterium]CAC9517887.1 hypothetical protein [uncultured Gamm
MNDKTGVSLPVTSKIKNNKQQIDLLKLKAPIKTLKLVMMI